MAPSAKHCCCIPPASSQAQLPNNVALRANSSAFSLCIPQFTFSAPPPHNMELLLHSCISICSPVGPRYLNLPEHRTRILMYRRACSSVASGFSGEGCNSSRAGKYRTKHGIDVKSRNRSSGKLIMNDFSVKALHDRMHVKKSAHTPIFGRSLGTSKKRYLRVKKI